jgi:glucokinase
MHRFDYAILLPMTNWIAVDIGGTMLRAACFQGGSLHPRDIQRIPAKHTTQPAIQQVRELICSIWPSGEEVSYIGVSAPGPVDPFSGTVLRAPSIPDWEDFPLQQILNETFHVPVFVGNDANLAAVGEWKHGAGKGVNDLIYLTISTGIGGGIIVNGQLLLGTRGLAGELGHTTVLPGGPPCSCGRQGHLEALASGPSIASWTQSELEHDSSSILPKGKPLTARQIAEAAAKGDPLAKTAFERAGTYLGQAISNFVNIFNPAMIILGGGVSGSGELLLVQIRRVLAEQVYSHHFLDTLKLTTAALGDNAGLLGALELAKTNFLSDG